MAVPTKLFKEVQVRLEVLWVKAKEQGSSLELIVISIVCLGSVRGNNFSGRMLRGRPLKRQRLLGCAHSAVQHIHTHK